jgi:PAS domain S-box-containing protein
VVVEPASGTSPLADELRTMLDGVADAVTVQAADGRLVYANDAAVRLGLPRAEALEGFITERYVGALELADEAGRPFDLAQLPGRLILTGHDPPPVTLRAFDRETGEVRWARIKAIAVRGPDSLPRLVINFVEDITELKRAEESQRFIAEASRRLSGSLDYARTLLEVAGLAVPALADECVVTVDGDAGGDAPPAAVADVLRTGTARFARDEIVVPMAAAGRVRGALTLRADGSGRRFDAHDLRVAEEFGLRAGAAVENARLYGAASVIARALQTSLLPPHLPDVPGAELAAAYRPASEGLEVGGDFYDVFATGEGQWYLVMGDVCGKGAEAAAVTALARYTLRTAAARQRSPASILRWVGDAMLDQDAAGGRYCTIACAHVDLARTPARLTVSCGGHPLPVLRRAGGKVEAIGAHGTLLGLVNDPDLLERSTDLRPGDTLILYTDGLTEAQAPTAMWGPEELAAVVRAAPEDVAGLVAGLVDAALRPLGQEALSARDDLAILALRMR